MQESDKTSNFDQSSFNPNDVGDTNGNLFGLPFDYDNANIIVVPIPWDLTTSYLAGTAYGPQAVLDYSPQIDLFDFDVPDAWKKGIYMLPISETCLAKNQEMRPKAEKYIHYLETHGTKVSLPTEMKEISEQINVACSDLKKTYRTSIEKILEDGKRVCVLGGDHSTPLALMEVLGEKCQAKQEEFGILQIDAHADLRIAYEGFELSHASIMYNALKIPNLSKLVSVGVRDLCEAEYEMAEKDSRIQAFYDHDIRKNLFTQEKNWKTICDEIIAELPQKVYVSFDIDGLKPAFCPNTGTPVPGGLDFSQAMFLLTQLVESGRELIGFDLSEVSVGGASPLSPVAEYNANVGSRILYKLCNLLSVES